jgi:hypothetical protein
MTDKKDIMFLIKKGLMKVEVWNPENGYWKIGDRWGYRKVDPTNGKVKWYSCSIHTTGLYENHSVEWDREIKDLKYITALETTLGKYDKDKNWIPMPRKDCDILPITAPRQSFESEQDYLERSSLVSASCKYIDYKGRTWLSRPRIEGCLPNWRDIKSFFHIFSLNGIGELFLFIFHILVDPIQGGSCLEKNETEEERKQREFEEDDEQLEDEIVFHLI